MTNHLIFILFDALHHNEKKVGGGGGGGGGGNKGSGAR